MDQVRLNGHWILLSNEHVPHSEVNTGAYVSKSLMTKCFYVKVLPPLVSRFL